MDSHFTPQDLQRIAFKKFIFHVIVKDDDKPTLLDEVPLTDEQEKFFKDRFRDAGKRSTEYEFLDKKNSLVVKQLDKMLKNPENDFLEISKELAISFHSYHKGNATDGIMVVAFVSLDDGKDLLLILKIDHQSVLRYKIDRSEEAVKAILEEVTNPIVKSKEALQKLAIIDVGHNYDWDVLAFDSKTSTVRVGQYFENFLTMKMRETEVRLMETTVKAVRQWATINQMELDKDQHISDYKERAIQYMEMHDQYETEQFLEYVVKDDLPERKDKLQSSLKGFLENEGVAGRNFSPQPELLKANQRRHEIQTEEGVKIQWSGSPEQNFIEFREPSNGTDGMYEINIRSHQIHTIK